MKNLWIKKVTLAFGLMLIFNNTFSQELTNVLMKKVDKSIIDAFSVETFKLVPIEVSDQINSITKADFSSKKFNSIFNGETKIGYAYIGKGKSMKDVFDYVILFDQNFIIKKTKVLIYRETYGTQIGSQRWLKQFIGKTTSNSLIYGDNIVAISGATISASSMSDEVNKVLSSLKILIEKDQL